MTPSRRVLTAAAALVAAAAVPVPSAAAASGRCPAGTGVTVVVDYGPLGGGVPVGCDPSGGGRVAAQVVPAAGFAITYVNGQPFVCRLNGKPTPAQDRCVQTPPANAYWGLFWSDGRSGSWSYASQGVASLKVPAGGSIGFRWQDGGGRDLPGAAPTTGRPEPAQPEPSQPEPQPSQPDEPPAGSGGETQGGGSQGGGSQGASADPSASPSPTASPSASASPSPSQGRRPGGAGGPTEGGAKGGSTSPAPTASPRGSATEAVVETADGTAAASAPADGGGSGGLTLVAGAAALLLAAAAGTLAWRRRS